MRALLLLEYGLMLAGVYGQIKLTGDFFPPTGDFFPPSASPTIPPRHVPGHSPPRHVPGHSPPHHIGGHPSFQKFGPGGVFDDDDEGIIYGPGGVFDDDDGIIYGPGGIADEWDRGLIGGPGGIFVDDVDHTHIL